MVLDTPVTEALRRAAVAGSKLPLPLTAFDEFTLAGLLELLATAISFKNGNDFAAYFKSQDRSVAGECWRVWQDGALPSRDIHSTRSVEFYRLRTANDCISQDYQLFRERFVRSLRASGFAREFAYALAGAFGEMGDNVIQHSGGNGDQYTGLAAYNVARQYMAFAVMDVGRGIYASLTSNPSWRVGTPREALRLAVCQNASRRIEQSQGDGFRTVFRSMVDRNSLLRFRSDDALLIIGDGGSHRQAVELCSARLVGLQLSACCALGGGKADERPIIWA